LLGTRRQIEEMQRQEAAVEVEDDVKEKEDMQHCAR
jgi:hypothetical protein